MTALPIPTTQEQDAERYQAEQSAAAEAFRLAHPEAWRKMLDGVMAGYRRDDPWTFQRRMGILERKAAESQGHPDFATWLNREYPRKDAA